MREDGRIRRALDIATALVERGIGADVRGFNVRVGAASIIEIAPFFTKYSGPRKVKIWNASASPYAIVQGVLAVLAQESEEEARFLARLAAEAAAPSQPEEPAHEPSWDDEYRITGKRTGD